MSRRLSLTKPSQTTLLTEDEINSMVDQFLGNELARSKDGTLSQEQQMGIAAEELRIQLDNLEMAKQRGAE